MKKLIFLLPLLLLSFPADASADSTIRTVTDASGAPLFTFCGDLNTGDEYISENNTLYRIQSVHDTNAIAACIGPEAMPDVSFLELGQTQPVFASTEVSAKNAKTTDKKDDQRKLIAMYVTHSDESYIPTDGTESKDGHGGIYDVARKFRDNLQAQGVDVILDESTHLPHDAGAYRRSRQTAERLLQKRPDAIIDIHRDGIPDEGEYEKQLDGKQASRIRLLVGKSNQNSAVNREFAKQLKAVADKQYPGLIKDIFIGKGNYNQDLSPNAILLEFGTHTITKDRVLASTELMADVVSTTLYGPQTGSAKAEAPKQEQKKNSSSMTGIVILIVAAVIGILIFALAQTGGSGMKNKITRGISEMTGGLMGKKPHKDN